MRAGSALLVVTVVGVWFGAPLLIAAPDRFVVSAVVVVSVASLAVELFGGQRLLHARRSAAVPKCR